MKHIRYTSASELTEQAFCEKKMLFAVRLGRRESRLRRQAQAVGDRAHEAFHRDAMSSEPRLSGAAGKPWCFIASEVFGTNASETRLLRAFRDRVLRRYAAGRAFVRLYYRHSPVIACSLHSHPMWRAATYWLLKAVVAVLAMWRI
ncbi:CFI-box-CTERM domain-containing protein [Massilia sp. YMA4]|uniref:CFI-box-CTERM domain-containing protein n=1 Tax=[Empedobacter] haloabium TaxID=592317 RepID=A0ABZ1UTC5_9BURK|nr:CFI-box-CTERM domain-containing protein [Massilia sp. YMA4]AXA91354.1 hypothetical protein DPH57_09435 [Massilia sp. YMA4]